jgi:hypothetical protein
MNPSVFQNGINPAALSQPFGQPQQASKMPFGAAGQNGGFNPAMFQLQPGQQPSQPQQPMAGAGSINGRYGWCWQPRRREHEPSTDGRRTAAHAAANSSNAAASYDGAEWDEHECIPERRYWPRCLGDEYRPRRHDRWSTSASTTPAADAATCRLEPATTRSTISLNQYATPAARHAPA